jgi:hypothetical protein
VDNFDSFKIVSNNRRRALLSVLEELGGKACLREIVKRVAEREEGEDFDKKLEKSIHVSLLQTHFPKMQNAGIIEYDEKTGIVRLQELPKEVRYHLEIVGKGDIPWSMYYLLLSILGLAASLMLHSILGITLSSCFLIASSVHAQKTYSTSNVQLTRIKNKLTKRPTRLTFSQKVTSGGEKY